MNPIDNVFVARRGFGKTAKAQIIEGGEAAMRELSLLHTQQLCTSSLVNAFWFFVLSQQLEQSQKEALDLLEQNRLLQDQLKVALGREQSAREGYVLQVGGRGRRETSPSSFAAPENKPVGLQSRALMNTSGPEWKCAKLTTCQDLGLSYMSLFSSASMRSGLQLFFYGPNGLRSSGGTLFPLALISMLSLGINSPAIFC